MIDGKTTQGSDDQPDAETERAEEGRKNRERMDDTPPPGTDPLHEGP